MSIISKKMIFKSVYLSIIFVIYFSIFFSTAYAEPIVSIIIEKTAYEYCEKLFYIIEVSEITGEPAIIHIRDETGKGSSAIPIPIGGLQNLIPAAFPFEKEQFAPGKYFIDVEYNGVSATSEFEIIDSDNICIPGSIKQFIIGWINGEIPDGYFVDAIQKNVDQRLIDVPFEVNAENILEINIPSWVKENVGVWWVNDMISDKDFAQVFNYLFDKKIIKEKIEDDAI
ncbi:MAG: hypothetical protein ACE5RB_08790 [Nitrosopumilus sp.]